MAAYRELEIYVIVSTFAENNPSFSCAALKEEKKMQTSALPHLGQEGDEFEMSLLF